MALWAWHNYINNRGNPYVPYGPMLNRAQVVRNNLFILFRTPMVSYSVDVKKLHVELAHDGWLNQSYQENCQFHRLDAKRFDGFLHVMSHALRGGLKSKVFKIKIGRESG